MHTKDLAYPLLATALLLLIPLVGNSFVEGWDWDQADFIIMGGLIFGFSFAYLLLSKLANTTASRVAIGGAMLFVFLLIWAELAVGVFGTPWAGS